MMAHFFFPNSKTHPKKIDQTLVYNNVSFFPLLFTTNTMKLWPNNFTVIHTNSKISTTGSQGEDWGWLREHSLKRASAPQLPEVCPGIGLELPKRQETFSCRFVSQRARRGDSERRLNELQKRAQAAAISVDPRGGRELRLTAWTPETGASRG